jgi:beta-mannosidase
VSRHIVDLSGDDWQLGQAPPDAFPDRANWQELDQVGDWLPATVPGNVRVDLARAGHLPDLTYGSQAESAQWVDDICWWLVRDFSLASSPDDRVHLILRGVDYVSDLFLNGQHLARHEGMFSPQIDDITGLLCAENRLAVRITGNRWLPHDRSTRWEKLLNHVEARFSSLASRFPHRRDTLKCQMGFGWDFAPPLRTMGIWDDVSVVLSKAVFIRGLRTVQRWTGDHVTLAVQVTLDTQRTRHVAIRCTLAGETFEYQPFAVEEVAELTPWSGSYSVEIKVPQPHLWWPWDHGRPDLYRLTVEVWDGDQVLDSTSQTVGLRQLELRDWAIHVNGQRVYARGANWVPADIVPGRVTADDYRALLAMARQANMNMLRVWGGGLREKRVFYDLCDRLGILVWQEFPIACAFVTHYPRSPEYLQLVEGEAQAIVRDLRGHPCLALWCGGNEFSPRRNRPLVAILQRVVAAEDPARLFLPASPAGGDCHNWRVWHDFQPPSAYLDDRAAFASEFGLQAPPDAATLRRFIPPEEVWPPGPSWSYHGAGLKKLERYARPFVLAPTVAPADHRQPRSANKVGLRPDGQRWSFGPPRADPTISLEDFIAASQRAQAYGLKLGIEHFRRRKASGGGGALVWQLNEPWPAISWSLLDFYRQPKPAYEEVKWLFSPVLLSVELPARRFRPGDPLQARVWIVNDLAEPLPGCHMEVTLWSGEGQATDHYACTVDVLADSAEVVTSLDWNLPAGGGWRLTCRLAREGHTLSANEYDLAVYDDLGPTLGQRLWIWLRGLSLRA